MRTTVTRLACRFLPGMICLLLCGQATCGVLFRDDFNGAIRPEWMIQHNDASYYSVTATSLDLRANNGDLWEGRTDYRNLFLVANPAPGDFEVIVKLVFSPVSQVYAQFDVLAFDDEDNHVRCYYGYVMGGTQALRALDNASEINGSYSGHGLTAQDFGSSPFWLKMEKLGTTYRQYWSTDGITFAPSSGVLTYGDGTPAKLGFVAFVDPTQSSHAYVDCFEVTASLLPGDANVDGKVDDVDASILAAHWQKMSGALWGDGDFTGDGAVTDLDASILAANWLESAPSAVPEPLAALLWMSGVPVLLWVSRRGTAAWQALPLSGDRL